MTNSTRDGANLDQLLLGPARAARLESCPARRSAPLSRALALITEAFRRGRR